MDAVCLKVGGVSVGGVVMEPLLGQHLQMEMNSAGLLPFGPHQMMAKAKAKNNWWTHEKKNYLQGKKKKRFLS